MHIDPAYCPSPRGRQLAQLAGSIRSVTSAAFKGRFASAQQTDDRRMLPRLLVATPRRMTRRRAVLRWEGERGTRN